MRHLRDFSLFVGVFFAACSPSSDVSTPSAQHSRTRQNRADVAVQTPSLAIKRPSSETNRPLKQQTGQSSNLLHLKTKLMGTVFQISFDEDSSNQRLISATQAAFREVSRIEKLMSEWRHDSELSRINKNAGLRPQKVSDETFQLLRQAQSIGQMSHGAFDITWAAFRGLWQFSGPTRRIPSPKEIKERLTLVGDKHLILDSNKKTAFLEKAGMSIGLGAIAKGYAIDRAAQILRDAGLRRFIMDGGGDLYLNGRKRSNMPWTIGIRHPRIESKIVVELPVEDAAIVTSGDYERFFVQNGKRYHHIIDLKTGRPSQKSVQVTVMAKNATIADAYATAIFVLGPESGIDLAQRTAGIEAAVFAPDGRITTTPKWRAVFPSIWQHRPPSMRRGKTPR